MDEIDLLFQDLADDPSDYERQGGVVLFTRQGQDYVLQVLDRPGSGPMVSGRCGDAILPELPLRRFVQEVVLQLHRLAAQIAKSVDRSAKTWPAPYIDGPAQLEQQGRPTAWVNTVSEFRSFLNEQEIGTTRLLQLMADAGQGKTVLLEQLARESSASYVPDQYPQPFLLMVDLLGRYVGTIDDAIAGALNNTFRFPRLTQRDVVLCIRQRWLVLALDGFDELVARVGVRDAFLRVTELLDQLNSSGTVILSARHSFFEVYQITSAIRSYLQPRQGSYSTTVLRLCDWSRKEGCEVFSALGSQAPATDLQGLLDAFGGEEAVVLQPFFLTRLAVLWVRGERFAKAAAERDPRWRTQYIIRELIDREASTKWTSKQSPLLSPEQHSILLQGIAEEMWRTGSFRLTTDELRIAAQIAALDMHLPAGVASAIEERITTHAAFVVRDGAHAFLHERFFHYYLGMRLASLMTPLTEGSLRAILETGDLPPAVCDWAEWSLLSASGSRPVGVRALLGLRRNATGTGVLNDNLGYLVARLMHEAPEGGVVERLTFVGDGFRSRRYVRVVFNECAWWASDLGDAKFVDCRFVRCILGDVAISAGTEFNRSEFIDCQFRGMDLDGKRMLFDPAVIVRHLESGGARIATSQVAPESTPVRRVDAEIVDGLGRLVRYATRSCDFAEDEVEDFMRDSKRLLRMGVETGVFRHSAKSTSGPHKDFLRFGVERQLFLRGQTERTGDGRIDAFWAAVEEKYPST